MHLSTSESIIRNRLLNWSELLIKLTRLSPKRCVHGLWYPPKKIWQEDEKSINQTKLNNFIDKISDSGYKVEAVEYGICYVDYKHCTTIFPNGKVDICNLDNPDGRAILGDDGDVVWYNEDLCFSTKCG